MDGFLEAFVHVEDVVGGCEHHVSPVFLVSQYHGLEHIDHLGDVGHAHAVCIFVEHVEHQGGHHSIAQAVLLVEVSGHGAWLLVPPGAPFVNHEANAFLGVGLVHNLAVLAYDVLDVEAFFQGQVVFFIAESRGLALVPPVLDGVVVDADGVHPVADGFHEHAGPVVVVVAGS